MYKPTMYYLHVCLFVVLFVCFYDIVLTMLVGNIMYKPTMYYFHICLLFCLFVCFYDIVLTMIIGNINV